MVSGFDRDDFVITAFKNGAVGYVLKAAGTAGCCRRSIWSPRAATTSARKSRPSCQRLGIMRGKAIPNETAPRERQVFHLMAEA